MIHALLTATALAATPIQLDVLAEIPERTTPITADTVGPPGGPSTLAPLSPRRTTVDVGFGLEALLGPAEHVHHPLISLGTRVNRQVYRHEGFTFDPVVVETHLDAGGLSWFGWRDAPPVDGYITYAAGLQVSALNEAPWPTTLAPAVHGQFGIGVGSRTGPVSVRVEGRVAAAVRFDNYMGRAQLAEGALEWQFWPGSASASILVGVGWRSPRSARVVGDAAAE